MRGWEKTRKDKVDKVEARRWRGSDDKPQGHRRCWQQINEEDLEGGEGLTEEDEAASWSTHQRKLQHSCKRFYLYRRTIFTLIGSCYKYQLFCWYKIKKRTYGTVSTSATLGFCTTLSLVGLSVVHSHIIWVSLHITSGTRCVSGGECVAFGRH